MASLALSKAPLNWNSCLFLLPIGTPWRFHVAPLIRVRSMVQVHLGPRASAAGQSGFCGWRIQPRKPRKGAGQGKVKAVFLEGRFSSLPLALSARKYLPSSLRYEVILTVREEMPIEVAGGPDGGVPHAAHYLKRVRALIDHERCGGVTELMKGEDIRTSGEAADFSRGGSRSACGNCLPAGTRPEGPGRPNSRSSGRQGETSMPDAGTQEP